MVAKKFHLISPYELSEESRWHLGNLHLHSTHSDGVFSPHELRDIYMKKGFDFFALTDHNCMGDQGNNKNDPEDRAYVLDLDVPPNDINNPPHFIALPGYEFCDVKSTSATPHVNCIGAKTGRDGVHRPSDDYQGAIDQVNLEGGFAFFNHPFIDTLRGWDFRYLRGEDPLMILRGLRGIELVNTGSIYYRKERKNPMSYGLCAHLWDEILSRGVKLWAYVGDDFHKFDEEIPCNALNVVLTKEFTREEIIRNLKTGNFYASTGLMITGIEVMHDTIKVVTDDIADFRFIGFGGKVLKETKEKETEYKVKGNEVYIRVEVSNNLPVFDDTPELRGFTQTAWTQPIFIE